MLWYITEPGQLAKRDDSSNIPCAEVLKTRARARARVLKSRLFSLAHLKATTQTVLKSKIAPLPSQTIGASVVVDSWPVSAALLAILANSNNIHFRFQISDDLIESTGNGTDPVTLCSQ